MENAPTSKPHPEAAPQEGKVFRGRFRALSIVKRHNGAETWTGIDEHTRRGVVLKLVTSHAEDPGAESRLNRESEALERAQSPYLVPLVASGAEDGTRFLVTDYIAGRTLRRVLDESGRTPILDTLLIAESIFQALEQIHAVNFVHGDVKPENIMITQSVGAPPAVLIDCGFARPVDEQGEQTLIGGLAYMAPEQSGLVAWGSDERADLYSAGVVLYECLAGRLPFSGENASDLIESVLTEPIEPLRTHNAGTPAALDAIVLRLLQRDPRDRYQSATGVIHDIKTLRQAMADGERDPTFTPGQRDVRHSVTEPGFTGRQQEVSEIGDSIAAAAEGTPHLVLLEGESGSGKSWLLDEISTRATQRGARVFRGGGLRDVAAQPLNVLLGVADGIAAHGGHDASFAEAIQQQLSPDVQTLRHIFPQLGSLLDAQEALDLGPEAFGLQRTIHAVSALVESLGAPGTPAVIILDDCQWADDVTLDFLREWNRRLRQRAAPRHSTLVLAFRSNEVPEDHPLRQLSAAKRLRLSAFTPQECRSLLESMAGPIPEVVYAFVCEHSAGSPFMASALLRGLEECGALTFAQGEWRVDATRLEDARASHRSGVFLVRRLERLGKGPLELLTAGAVLGRTFDIEAVSALTARPPEALLATLEEIRRHHLVWTQSGRHSYAFAHDKIREALLERLPPEQRKALHLLAAAHYEQQSPRNDFDISHHFANGDAPERALPFALRAANEARSRNSLDIACQHYRIAQAGEGAATPHVRCEIAEGLGDTLMLRGQYAESLKQFERAQLLAHSLFAQASIDGKMGELAFKRGDVETAARFVESGLARLGRPVPSGRWRLLVGTVWEVLLQTLHTLLPRLLLHRRKLDHAAPELLAARLYSRLAHVYWFGSGALACLWAHLRGLNLAEQYPPTRELAQAYSEHAPVMTVIPLFNRGIRYVQRSLQIRRELKDVWGEAQALHFLGVVLYGASRYADSLEACKAAVALVERAGDHWELNTANWHSALAHYRRGELDDAVRTAKAVYSSAEALGDAQARLIGLGVWSKAATGLVPAGLFAGADTASSADVHATAEFLQGEAVFRLRHGEPIRAIEALTQARRAVQRKGFRQEYVAPIDSWTATALRVRLEGLPSYARAERRRVQRAMAAATRRARMLSFFYRNNLPHALRESAYFAAMEGNETAARGYIRRSVEVADQQGAALERAASVLARGEIGRGFGWPGADDDIALGQEHVDALTASVREQHALPRDTRRQRVSLEERFDRLLECTRDIASAATDTEVLAMVRGAGLRVLRGHRAEVIRADEVATAPEWVSRSVLTRTERKRGVVTVTEGLHPGGSDSLVLTGTRSVLCAPIFFEGDLLAYLYVTHSAFGSFFGATEERVAALIATLATAALKNVAGAAEARAAVVEQEGLIERAREAIEARDAFISIASHELKTPLTALKLQAQMLSKELSGGSRPRALASNTRGALAGPARIQNVNRQVERMVTLVDQLLDVSRITMGRFDLRREAFDLRALVIEVVDRLTPSIAAAQCEAQLDLGDSVVGHWDRSRMDQVISNLLSNAVKYGAGAPIRIRLEHLDGDVELTVQDHGIGIPREARQRIFDRFERLVSDRNYGGFGLGLWIVRQIVETHGGAIGVSSSPGQGSLFKVSLPVTEPKEVPPC